MQDIHLAHLDKSRPVVVLTREPVRSAMHCVSVAPITSTIKGPSTEVSVGVPNGLNGLDQPYVVSCDNVITIDRCALGRHIGSLLERREPDLTAAIVNDFALRTDSPS